MVRGYLDLRATVLTILLCEAHTTGALSPGGAKAGNASGWVLQYESRASFSLDSVIFSCRRIGVGARSFISFEINSEQELEPENHTLHSGMCPYSLDMGVPSGFSGAVMYCHFDCAFWMKNNKNRLAGFFRNVNYA